MQRLFVIDRDLFTRMNVAQGKEHYMPKDRAYVGVRFARVIDVMRAVTPAAAVDAPDAVHVADAQLRSMRASLCFAIRNALARVLGYFAPVWKIDSGKAASAVDW